MTNLNFAELDRCFRNNDFTSIENDNRGIRFLKLRSMSRRVTMEEFCEIHNIDIEELGAREYFQHIFNLEIVTDERINDFINLKYQEERQDRVENQDMCSYLKTKMRCWK